MTTHPGRRRWPVAVLLVLVLLVAGAGGAAYGLGWVDHWRGTDVPPASPPAPLALSPLTPGPAVVARQPSGGTPSAAAQRRALAGPLADKSLGKHVVAAITPAAGGTMTRFGTGLATPASITKLMTTTAALEVLGGDTRFTTSVRRAGHRLFLVGGGDPLLDSDDLAALARTTARGLKTAGVRRVRLDYDVSLFTGPSVAPTWRSEYIPEEVVPVGALILDEGHTAGPDGQTGTADDGRVSDPPGAAAAAFAGDLRRAGITVRGTPASAHATGPVVARRQGQTLNAIVEHTLRYSDNQAAEMLGRQVGLTAGDPSFSGGVATVTKTLVGLGIPADGIALRDSSGLSRQGKLSTAAVSDALLLATSGDHPELSAVLSGLPVAGFDGSLENRFVPGTSSAGGAGVVRAKTGTLTGVSGLAGVVTDEKGTPFVVVVIADQILPAQTLDARLAEEDVLAAVAGCGCS